MDLTGLVDRLLLLPDVTDAVVLESVDSTNLEAQRRIGQGAGAGLVVVAQRQTAGRGRRARRWEDVAGGNLAISLVVDLPATATTVGLVPLAAALGLGETIGRLGLEASLKWPNDVRLVVHGKPRKCAGILVEANHPARRSFPATTGVAVIGIGLDVDWREVTRDEDREGWTSLAEALDEPVDHEAITLAVVADVHAWLARQNHDRDAVLASYRQACDTLGQQVAVQVTDENFEGVAERVTDDGLLEVATSAGRRTVAAGDVVHLRESRSPA